MSINSIPNLLDAILRDATLYFFVMFSCQLVLLMFLFFAPVSGLYHLRGWLNPLRLSYMSMFRRKFSSCPECTFSFSLTSKPFLSAAIDINLGLIEHKRCCSLLWRRASCFL